jgi:hypothetical protein
MDEPDSGHSTEGYLDVVVGRKKDAGRQSDLELEERPGGSLPPVVGA